MSWFDKLIENKKRQNEVLEKVAMAIFKSWFIDFEPFQDGEFVSSELGEIPEQWCVKPLEEVAKLFKGVSYSSSDIGSEPQGSLFITLNNFLRGGGFKSEYDYYIGSKVRDEQKVKEGDLIIALTDMTPLAKVVGAPAIVSLPYGYDFGVISLDCGKLHLRKECLRFYLYLYLKHTQEENSTFANGVNVLHLNTNLFMRNKLILMPPEPILEKFHALVEPLFQKIALNQKQILVLRKVRDTLLPLLVFGKLRVEEI
ncbi:MAG: restriction endonuclease subunit S [Candidatus Jordarchaeaceae archaeon]